MEIGFQPGEGIPSGWTLAFFTPTVLLIIRFIQIAVIFF